jgi:hypothetical protein
MGPHHLLQDPPKDLYHYLYRFRAVKDGRLAVWVLGEPMTSNDNNVLFNNNINNNFELSRVKNKNGLKLGCGCSDVGPVESSG